MSRHPDVDVPMDVEHALSPQAPPARHRIVADPLERRAASVPPKQPSFLESRVARIPAALRSILSDLQNYPAFIYTQLAKNFPSVHRADLDRTVERLLDCHARYANLSIEDGRVDDLAHPTATTLPFATMPPKFCAS